MAAKTHGSSRARWMVAIAVAFGALAGVTLLFRAPPIPSAPASPASGKFVVQLAPPGAADAVLRQEAELRDLRPLFLPTARSAAVREPRREPGRTFLDDTELKLKFSDAELHVDPPVVALNGVPVGKASAVDALTLDTDLAGLTGFGRRPGSPPDFKPRGGFVEVVATRDGATILAEPLAEAARPASARAWGPMEFVAAVDSIGLTGPLVLTEGSRIEEVDAHFRRYLTQEFRIGARLPPGFYRITVAP